MLQMTTESLAGLPAFLTYLGLALVFTLVFIRIYTWLTPHDEFALIRQNNLAAAVAFGGALLGFALPLSNAIAVSMSLIDCAVWSAIALVVQALTFVALRFAFSDLPKRIENGEMAAATFVAASAIAVGLINSACLTY